MFVVDKDGKVLVAEAGSPDGTVEVVRKIVAGAESGPATTETDAEIAKTASEVADTAAKVDGEVAA